MDTTMVEQESVTSVGMQPVSPEVRKRVEAAFRSYESRLFHAALRITRNDDDAWDAVQEGMVSALRHADRFRGDAAVASWMYSIVVNAALYQRRRTVARRRGADKYTEKVWPEAERSLEAGTTFCDPESWLLSRVELGRALEAHRHAPRGEAHPPRAVDRRRVVRRHRRRRRSARGRREEPPVAHPRGPARADGPRGLSLRVPQSDSASTRPMAATRSWARAGLST